MPESHAFFSASSAHRWLACTASAVINGPPDESNAAADRGTWLHGVAERALKLETDAPLDELIDTDRVDVQPYVDYMRSREGVKFYEVGGELLPNCGGTSDGVVVGHGDGWLEIVDYKSGYQPVDPKENPQLVIYALVCLKNLELPDQVKRVRMTIVQPRAYAKPQSWEVPVSKLRSWEKRIAATVRNIQDGIVSFSPSEKACKWCPAKAVCPAQGAVAKAVARNDFSEELGEPAQEALQEAAEMTLEAKLVLVPLVTEWAAAVIKERDEAVLRGDGCEGFKSVRGRKGNRSWREGARDHVVATLSETVPVDMMVNSALRTPKQVEDAIKKVCGKEKAAAKELLGKIADVIAPGRPGSLTVVPADDRRPEVTPADAAREDFAEDLQP